MEFIKALLEKTKLKDSVHMDRLEYNKVRLAIEEQCDKYLKNSTDIFKFEALPSALDATIECLESKQFQERYEFNQVSKTCFIVRLRELNIL